MAFFGITTYGPIDPIKDSVAPTQNYVFHEIPMERYLEVFQNHAIGDTNVAKTLEIDGKENVLRSALGDMLMDVLGRPPRRFELDAWFTHCDFDRSGVLSLSEYYKAVEKLIAFSSQPEQPKEYTSFSHYHKDWTKHTRVNYEPQSSLRGPMTTQQEVGWHTKKPAPQRENFALGTTDVTQKEGRDPKAYYGHFCFL